MSLIFPNWLIALALIAFAIMVFCFIAMLIIHLRFPFKGKNEERLERISRKLDTLGKLLDKKERKVKE